MTYVVTFTGYRPPPRYDEGADRPYIEARIEESAAATGPWTPIDTVALVPVDADPSAPAARNMTTAEATLEAGWYRVIFVDADGAESPTQPVENTVDGGTDRPLLATRAELTRYLHTTGGGQGADPTLLDLILAAASDRIIQALPERTLYPAPPTSDPPVARPFRTSGRTIQVPDLRAVDSIEIAGTAIDLDTIELDAVRPGAPALFLRLGAGLDPSLLVGHAAYLYGGAGDNLGARRRVTVTGWWGPDEVEPMAKHATLVWAARAYHERTARFADAVADPNGGAASYFRQLPADVAGIIASMRVPGT